MPSCLVGKTSATEIHPNFIKLEDQCFPVQSILFFSYASFLEALHLSGRICIRAGQKRVMGWLPSDSWEPLRRKLRKHSHIPLGPA